MPNLPCTRRYCLLAAAALAAKQGSGKTGVRVHFHSDLGARLLGRPILAGPARR